MTRVGIVGSEGAKFTVKSEARARAEIQRLLAFADRVVSGACHLGGIDKWAAEEGRALGIDVREYPPKAQSWTHYKARNLDIAKNSDEVWCITVDRLPVGYTGMTFPLCYHCKTDTHVKSGGCWTVKQALLMGKSGGVIVLPQED